MLMLTFAVYAAEPAEAADNVDILELTGEEAQIAFIERFYVNILNRPSDQVGLDGWLAEIKSKSGAAVAFGFFNSAEFFNLQLDNTDFVFILYSTLFDRLPDQAGLDFWLSKLEAGEIRELIIYGFLRSQEFDNLANSFDVIPFSDEDEKLFKIKSFVDRFYQIVLNRKPDLAGFNDWSLQIFSGSKPGGDIAIGFFNSPEFINRNTTVSEFLDIAYSAFFDRVPDGGGKNAWTILLSEGMTRLQVVDGFVGSQEFFNLAASFGVQARFPTVFTAALINNQTFHVVSINSNNEPGRFSFQFAVNDVTVIFPDDSSQNAIAGFSISDSGSLFIGTDPDPLVIGGAPSHGDYIPVNGIGRMYYGQQKADAFYNQLLNP